MIKRLGLFTNTAETDLIGALIDKSHDKIKFSQLRKMIKNISSEKYLMNLLLTLKKYTKSSSYTLRIKSLIALHYFLKKTMFQNQKIMTFAEDQLIEMKEKKIDDKVIQGKKKVQLQNQQKQYIQKNIIQFYVLYLLKYMVHKEAYTVAKLAVDNPKENFGITIDSKLNKGFSKGLQTTSVTKLPSETKINVEENTIMFHINVGFEILNLINFIIQSQETFNKMGRYYLQNQEILNLFIMYLDDLTIYNDYTKKLAKVLTKSINHIKEEQLKHCFLYLTESQKTSDRLYEFYYNRYYYTKVKKLISMPTFLLIDNEEFERVVREIKKVDRELVAIVKDSKYSQEYRMNKTVCLTEPNEITNNISKINKTMMTETGHKKLNTITKTLENLSNQNRSKLEIEENITRYIQTFDNIQDQNDQPMDKQDFA